MFRSLGLYYYDYYYDYDYYDFLRYYYYYDHYYYYYDYYYCVMTITTTINYYHDYILWLSLLLHAGPRVPPQLYIYIYIYICILYIYVYIYIYTYIYIYGRVSWIVLSGLCSLDCALKCSFMYIEIKWFTHIV